MTNRIADLLAIGRWWLAVARWALSSDVLCDLRAAVAGVRA